jgi:hypothetical protein
MRSKPERSNSFKSEIERESAKLRTTLERSKQGSNGSKRTNVSPLISFMVSTKYC